MHANPTSGTPSEICTAVAMQPWSGEGGEAWPVFVAPIDLYSFEPAWFEQANIACPAPIANSVRKRQAEFFYGRLCARAALARLQADPSPIPIGCMREPVWPSHIRGSITHSRSMAAAVALPASLYGGVGIDIEEVAASAALDSLTSIVASTREMAYLATLTGWRSIDVLLTIVFSVKESFFKSVFNEVQRFFDFNAVEIEHIDVAQGTVWFAIRQPLCARFGPGDRCRARFALIDGTHVMTAFLWRADESRVGGPVA